MKKKIALVTGGLSGEAQISYKSAVTIYNNLDKAKYDVFKIDISPDGWIYEDEDGKKSVIDRNDFSINTGAQKVRFDAVFIGIHGTPGEDGKLQGYFDMLRIPYTSCNAAVSALTFNKRYTTAVAGASGIAVAKSVLLIKDQFTNADGIVANLKFPVFVKPNNGGSSIGMSKVSEASEELGAAIEKAFKEDDQVLVEEMIWGREFTVGVFRNGGNVEVLNITEVSTDKVFFDFEAKYSGKSKEVTPAEMPDAWREKVEATAKKIYEVFNCRGVIRIDFIYNEKTEEPFMLEINTIPGQSDASIVPQQVQARGWTLQDFYSKIVDDALQG